MSTEDKLSIAAAKKQLDDDHCGLEKIKRRIVEYLAVLKLRKDMKVRREKMLFFLECF